MFDKITFFYLQFLSLSLSLSLWLSQRDALLFTFSSRRAKDSFEKKETTRSLARRLSIFTRSPTARHALQPPLLLRRLAPSLRQREKQKAQSEQPCARRRRGAHCRFAGCSTSRSACWTSGPLPVSTATCWASRRSRGCRRSTLTGAGEKTRRAAKTFAFWPTTFAQWPTTRKRRRRSERKKIRVHVFPITFSRPAFLVKRPLSCSVSSTQDACLISLRVERRGRERSKT